MNTRVFAYDVTIAMPVYQAADFIEESLRSALAQSYESIEFLLIDDCGRDNAMEIAARVRAESPRGGDIYVCRNPRNMGCAASRNAAIALARGRYIFFMDADDRLEPDAIETMMAAAEEHDADMVVASYRDVAPGETHDNLAGEGVFTERGQYQHYVFGGGSRVPIEPWNKLIRTELLRGKPISFPDLRISEDLPFAFRLLSQATRVVTLKQITYSYTIHPGSICQNNPREVIPIDEIRWHVRSRLMAREIARGCRGETFYPEIVATAMDFCFGLAAVIVRKRDVISQPVDRASMRRLISYPISPLALLGRWRLLRRHGVRYVVGRLPLRVFETLVRMKR